MKTVRKGIIGEHKVIIDLLEKGWDVYTPVVDDGGGVDLISICLDCAWTIQVKYQHFKRNEHKTSWDIRVKPTRADYIAIPIMVEDDEHILYYPHFGKSTENKSGTGICISVKEPKNKQVKNINWWEDFLHLPKEEING